MLQNNLFLNDYITSGKNDSKYHINLNPTFPLIYEFDSNSSFKIIGNELNMIKLVRGINDRGIILSYIHGDDYEDYVTHVYIKCNKSESNGNIEFINKTEFDFKNHYFFSVESNISCPYCLDSEINEIKTDGICHKNNTELFNIEIKENSNCVIKPYENATSTLIINDNSQFLLYYNSSSTEDQSFIINYNIKENIPIFYEKEDDYIITQYQRYKKCNNESHTDEPEENNNEDFPVGYIILIVFGSLILIIAIIIIVWRIYKSHGMKSDENEIISGDGPKDLNLKSASEDTF